MQAAGEGLPIERNRKGFKVKTWMDGQTDGWMDTDIMRTSGKVRLKIDNDSKRRGLRFNLEEG